MINPPQDKLQHLIILYRQEQFQEALEKAEKLIQKFPSSFVLYNIIGTINLSLKQFDTAIESYKKALNIKYDYAEAYNNMGNALHNKGEINAAINGFKEAIKIKPNYAEAFNNLGNALRDKEELNAAIKYYKKSLRIRPNYAEAYNNMGNALYDKGELTAAIENYKQAIKIKPDFAEAFYNMGNSLKEKKELKASIENYKKAVQINPKYAEAHYNMGIAFYETGDLEATIVNYKKSLKINPNYTEAYNAIGNLLKAQGKINEAIESYQQALKTKSYYTEAHYNISQIKSYKNKDEHFVQMQKILEDQKITDEQRCHLYFALGKASEDLQDFSNSFVFFNKGNTLRKKLLGYNISKDIKLFEDIKKSYPYIKKNTSINIKKSNGPNPIFILGMPRSGTTLVEQIVSSHSEVTGAGELNYIHHFGCSIARGTSHASNEKILKFRKNYLSELQNRSDGNFYVTDKLPHNFIYVGLIYLSFPEAKIIHVKRNPSATSWSNYKTFFSSNGNGYCYDLNDLVSYYGLYRDLMQFWQEHCYNRIYDLNYENLTSNQEEETKNLIQYLDLEWQDTCLFPQDNNRSVKTASNLQIRKKIYQGSSEKWLNFEQFLKGSFDEL